MSFFNGLLTRVSHPFTTATAQCGALTGVYSVGRLNVVLTTPAPRPSVANASHHATLSGLATRPGEKSGLKPLAVAMQRGQIADPVESRAGVALASRSDVAMAGDPSWVQVRIMA